MVDIFIYGESRQIEAHFVLLLSLLLLLLLLWGGHFWNFSMCSFSEVYSKVARFFLSSQNPSNTLERCVQELPDFWNPCSKFQLTFPEVRSKRCVKEVCSKRCVEHTSGNVISKVIKSFFLNYDWDQRRRSVKGSLSCSFPLYFTLRRLCQRAPKTRKTN